MNWTKVGYVSVISGVASLAVGTWLYWRADTHVQPVDIAELMNGIIERQKALTTAYSTSIETSEVVSAEWAVDGSHEYQVWDTNTGDWVSSNYLYETTVTNTVVWTNISETLQVSGMSIVQSNWAVVGRYIVAITNAVYTNAGVVTTNWWTNDAAASDWELTTNAIDWHKPRASAVDTMQDEIRELIPYYADTNLFFDEGTNWLINYSVTGLFAALSIGDGTNEFTRTPAIGTNSAAYGAPEAHVYTNTLIEMYRVLSSLTYVLKEFPVCTCKSQKENNYNIWEGDPKATWSEAKSDAESDTPTTQAATNVLPRASTIGLYGGMDYEAAILRLENSLAVKVYTNDIGTPSVHSWYLYAYITMTGGSNYIFDTNGEIPHSTNNVWAKLSVSLASQQGEYLISDSIGDYDGSAPNWCDDPTGWPGTQFERGYISTAPKAILDYSGAFQYCTNSIP